MSLKFQHVHVKSDDPAATAKFYLEVIGGKLIDHSPEIPRWRINLNGTMLLVSPIAGNQDRKQLLGIEHLAFETTTFDEDIKRLTDDGVKVLLIQASRAGDGTRTGYLESADGEHQLEILEMKA